MAEFVVTIDRVVLDGLEVTPQQAGRLQELLENELTARLRGAAGRQGLGEDLEMAHLRGSNLRLTRPLGEEGLATALAGSLGQALNGLATESGKGDHRD